MNSSAAGGCKQIPSETIWLSSYLHLTSRPPASLRKIRPGRRGGLICLRRTACGRAGQVRADTWAEVAILTPQAHGLAGHNETLTFQELRWRFKGREIPSDPAKGKKTKYRDFKMKDCASTSVHRRTCAGPNQLQRVFFFLPNPFSS